jgi:hypothetical protein
MNSPQDPSPSSTPEVVALGGTARASPARAFGILDLIFGPTGRRVRGDRHHHTVRNWIRCTDDTSLRAHAGCEQFVQELRRVQIIRVPLQCYRGRTPPFRSEVPDAEEMGPPTHAEAGRYNRDGIGVLYMSDLEMGVQRELRERARSGPSWVQRFVITPQARGIADLTMVDPASVIASACWFAELAAKVGEPTFAFSQFVAALVSDGFDGMRVPGVRGTDAARYTNVVMFSPAERWRDWIDTSTVPTRLALDESAA